MKNMSKEQIEQMLRESMYGFKYMLGKYSDETYIDAVLINIKHKLTDKENENTAEQET